MQGGGGQGCQGCCWSACRRAEREVWGGRASPAAQVSEAGWGQRRALGVPWDGRCISPFPAERPQGAALLSFPVSLLHCSLFLCPYHPRHHPLSTRLSQAPKRSAHGQPGGCCMSPQAQWKDCRWADVTSARRTRLILLQGGTLSNRNKHPLCWGQTRQGPSEGSAPLAPELLAWQPPLQASMTH